MSNAEYERGYRDGRINGLASKAQPYEEEGVKRALISEKAQRAVRAVLEKHYHGQPTVFIDQLWNDVSAEIAAIITEEFGETK